MSVWYGTSKSGTTGSPNLSTSTFSLSSLPIGTDGSIIFGMTIMFFRSSSSTSFSLVESSSILAPEAATCFFTSSASSFFPCPIKAPICFEILFLSARKASTSCLISLFSLSSSSTLSTSSSLLSWNLLRIFCFTISGFSLTNLISNILSSCYLFFFSYFSNSKIHSLSKSFYLFLA